MGEADVPDVKLQKMVKRAEVTLELGREIDYNACTEAEKEFITLLAAVYAKTLKAESQELAEKQRVFIKEKSVIATLDETTAVESAKIQAKMKKEIEGWGLADSIVYATALLKKAEVVTGDEHFKKLKNVLFIK